MVSAGDWELDDMWMCQNCTYMNSNAQTRCLMCSINKGTEKEEDVSSRPTYRKVEAISALNGALATAMPYLNLKRCNAEQADVKQAEQAVTEQSLYIVLARVRAWIAFSTLEPFLSLVLQDERRQFSSQTRVNFNRILAMNAATKGTKAKQGAQMGIVPEESSHQFETLFGQAFQQLGHLNPIAFRGSYGNRICDVTFEGEGSTDAGGPYREAFDFMMQELQSDALFPSALLIRTPNHAGNTGTYRDCWILNPSASSSPALQQLVFLGRLMGYALRTRGYLNLCLAPLVWKQLLDLPLSIQDLEQVDVAAVQSTEFMRSSPELTADNFSEVFADETFTTTLSDGRIVDLKPGGSEIPVRFEEREDHARLTVHARLHEADRQLEALHEGFYSVVAPNCLKLVSWQALEKLVSGEQVINITLLKKNTSFSSDFGQAWEDNFWNVFEHDFTEEDRRAYLRFVFGRSRLPLNASEFSDRHKVTILTRSEPDQYLPVAHTCFFSIDVPLYSSREIIYAKLLYAVKNCVAIDADRDGVDRSVWAGLSES